MKVWFHLQAVMLQMHEIAWLLPSLNYPFLFPFSEVKTSDYAVGVPGISLWINAIDTYRGSIWVFNLHKGQTVPKYLILKLDSDAPRSNMEQSLIVYILLSEFFWGLVFNSIFIWYRWQWKGLQGFFAIAKQRKPDQPTTATRFSG